MALRAARQKDSAMAANQCRAANTDAVLLRAVGMCDLHTIEALAQDVFFGFGNADPTGTRSELVTAVQSLLAASAGMDHEVVDIWEIGDGAAVDVHYRRPDGRALDLLCSNVFRVSDGSWGTTTSTWTSTQ